MVSVAKTSHNRERLILSIIAAMMAVSPFTMEAYMPAMQNIAHELNTSIVQVNYTISTFLIGGAIGELFGGPISDQLGRKPNVILGMGLFLIATVGIALAHDIQVIQILRFMQALGAGFAAVVGLPTLRDMFDPETAAKKLPLVVAAIMVAPMIAPVIGTLLMHWSWRAIFAFLAIYGSLILALYLMFVPTSGGNGKRFSFKAIGTQFAKVISFTSEGKPVALYYLMLQGFLAGVFLTFLTNVSWVYLSNYQVSLALLPFFFVIHTGTTFLSNLFISKLVHKIDPRIILRIGSYLQPAALVIMYLLMLNGRLSLTAFTVLFVPVVVGANLMVTSLRALMLSYFEKLTGSATSLISLCRFTFGALGGVLSGIFFDHTMSPIVTIMLISSVGAFVIVNALLPNSSIKQIVKLERPAGY
jgi:DHA1 family bicyclomycin/chloramphenicol resistance-like MFS transporter